MKYCKDCLCFKDCQRLGQTADFPVDDGVCLNFVQMTNADRIRAMSDEELAALLPLDICVKIRGDNRLCNGWCDECVSDWLKQPVKDGDNDGV